MKSFLIKSILIFTIIILILINFGSFEKICNIQNLGDLANLFPKNQIQIEYIIKKTKKQLLQDLDHLKNCDNTKTIYVYDKLATNYKKAHTSIRIIELLHPDVKLQSFARERLKILEKFYKQKLSYNFDVYHKLKQAVVNENLKNTLKNLLKKYESIGINLPKDQIVKLKELIREIDELEKNFENEASYNYAHVEISEDELQYLKESVVNLIKDNKLELTNTVYGILQTNKNENIRKKIWYAYSNRAAKNKNILKDLIKLRHKFAKMLNYKNFTEFEISDEMAKNSKNVRYFLKKITPYVQKKFNEEFSKLIKNLSSDIKIINGKINPWDIAYAQKKSLNKQLDFKYTEYFELNQTLDKMFEMFGNFLDIKIKKLDNHLFWDKQIIALEIFENNQSLGFILLDLFRRQNKYKSAFEVTLVPSTKDCKGAALVSMNWQEKRSQEPYLLSFENLITIFHEFGHAIHDILGKTELNITAGTKVDKDYLEMPSQVFQEWPTTPKILQGLSSHYKNGKQLTDNEIKLILDFYKYGEGFKYLYQIYYALVSLNVFEYAEVDPFAQDAEIFAQTLSAINYFPNYSLTSFVHLADYNSRYYAYLWSRVFALDIMEKIKNNNFSKEIGKRFKEILLRPGGSRDAEILLKSFLNREPDVNAFVRSLN